MLERKMCVSRVINQSGPRGANLKDAVRDEAEEVGQQKANGRVVIGKQVNQRRQRRVTRGANPRRILAVAARGCIAADTQSPLRLRL